MPLQGRESTYTHTEPGRHAHTKNSRDTYKDAHTHTQAANPDAQQRDRRTDRQTHTHTDRQFIQRGRETQRRNRHEQGDRQKREKQHMKNICKTVGEKRQNSGQNIDV